MIVVADTSPLSYLIQIEAHGLLPALIHRSIRTSRRLLGAPASISTGGCTGVASVVAVMVRH